MNKLGREFNKIDLFAINGFIDLRAGLLNKL